MSQVKRPRVAIQFCAAAVILLSGFSCPRERGDRDPLRTVKDCAAALQHRPFSARLAAPFTHRPLLRRMRGVSDRDDDPQPLAAHAELVRVAKTPADTAAARRARADALLLLGNPAPAIANLTPLCSADDADACTDLAAAHLTHAEHSGLFVPNIDALAAADHALALQPWNAAALFNRALALERLGLSDVAAPAWRVAAGADTTSAWRSEALAAQTRVRIDDDLSSWKRILPALEQAVRANDGVRVQELVDRYPEQARRWTESAYPCNWADAVLRGDPTSAAQALALVRALTEALARRSDDRLFRDALATIEHVGEHGELLARAYATYREGRIAHSKYDSTRAKERLAVAVELFHRERSPLELVARYYLGSALFAGGDLAASGRLLADVASVAEQRGYTSLVANTGWERGSIFLTRGAMSRAADTLSRSRELFERLGERQMVATIDEFLGDIYDFNGDVERAWELRHRSLLVQSASRRRLTTMAAAINGCMRRQEWSRAASLLSITFAVAQATGDAVNGANALVQRRIVHAKEGAEAAADADLREYREWTNDPKHSGLSIPRLQADLDFAEGLVLRRRDIEGSLRTFERAIAYYTAHKFSMFAPSAYLERARTFAVAGRLDEASADIDAGLRMTDAQRNSIRPLDERAVALENERDLRALGIGLALSQQKQVRAFDLAEGGRARALLDAFEGAGNVTEPSRLDEVQNALAPNAAVLEYASTPARAVVFVVRKSDVALRELPSGEGGVRPSASPEAQYDAWIAPIADLLRGIDLVAIVPDAGQAGVAFGNLQDRHTGRRLLEDFSLVIAPSASLAIRSSQRCRAAGTATSITTFEANVFDRERHDDLEEPKGTVREGQLVAAEYPRAMRVSGSALTPSRFLTELRRATAIHFAGHGVLAPEHPAESALVVAPESGDGDVTAADIATLRLDQLRLAYLSSCESGTPNGRPDGVQNVATAFLMARVPTIVASAGQVDDQNAIAIAARFHQVYRRTGDAATAAREAILASQPWRDGDRSAARLAVIGGTRNLVN